MSNIPPPPNGFELETPPAGEPLRVTVRPSRETENNGSLAEIPRPPDGFVLDAPAEQQPKYGGKVLNTTAGMNSGLYTTLGAPVDASRWVVNRGIDAYNYLTGDDVENLPADYGLGSRKIGQLMGEIDPVLDPANTVASTTTEKALRAGGEGVSAAVLPQAVVGLAAKAPALANAAASVAKVTGPTASTREVLGNAVVGGASGAGSGLAVEAAPEPWKPTAALVGGMVAGAPQDAFRIAKDDSSSSVLGKLLMNAGGAGSAAIGAWLGGPITAAAGVIGAQTVASMRLAGLETMDDILVDAMLNPERARVLMTKTSGAKPDRLVTQTLANAYKKAASTSAILTGAEALPDGSVEQQLTPAPPPRLPERVMLPEAAPPPMPRGGFGGLGGFQQTGPLPEFEYGAIR